MRDGSRKGGARAPLAKGLRALALSFTTCCGLGVAGRLAAAAGVPQGNVQPVAYLQEGPSSTDLQNRLDQQQVKIDQLQAQLSGMQTAVNSSTQVQATPVSMETATANADMVDGPKLPPGATVTDNVKTPLNAYWNNGLWFSSANEDFKVHVGGRIQFDAANEFEADAHTKTALANTLPFSQGFRRDRVRMEGSIYENVDFVWEYDFATAENPRNFTAGPQLGASVANGASVFTGTGITDMNATLKYLPVIGNVSVGSFLVPFSFELATSDRWMDFIERSAAFDAFVPATNFANYTLGARQFTWNEQETITEACSVSTNNFWNGASGFDFGDAYMVNTRITALPLWCDDGRYLIHVGADFSSQDCAEDPLTGLRQTQLRSRLATREYLSPLTPSMVNTGNIVGTIQNTVGAELVSQWGAWTFESEFYGSWVEGDNGVGGTGNGIGTDTLFFKGMYAQAMYMLTGENRIYNRQRGNFERVVPYENYFRSPGDYNTCTGRGAWQVGARYSYVDLNSDGIHGGVDNEFTAGLNWFLNPNLKFQFNYDYTVRTEVAAAGDGEVNGFGTRMVLDF